MNDPMIYINKIISLIIFIVPDLNMCGRCEFYIFHKYIELKTFPFIAIYTNTLPTMQPQLTFILYSSLPRLNDDGFEIPQNYSKVV